MRTEMQAAQCRMAKSKKQPLSACVGLVWACCGCPGDCKRRKGAILHSSAQAISE
jgi:hypothetical protein